MIFHEKEVRPGIYIVTVEPGIINWTLNFEKKYTFFMDKKIKIKTPNIIQRYFDEGFLHGLNYRLGSVVSIHNNYVKDGILTFQAKFILNNSNYSEHIYVSTYSGKSYAGLGYSKKESISELNEAIFSDTHTYHPRRIYPYEVKRERLC